MIDSWHKCRTQHQHDTSSLAASTTRRGLEAGRRHSLLPRSPSPSAHSPYSLSHLHRTPIQQHSITHTCPDITQPRPLISTRRGALTLTIAPTAVLLAHHRATASHTLAAPLRIQLRSARLNSIWQHGGDTHARAHHHSPSHPSHTSNMRAPYGPTGDAWPLCHPRLSPPARGVSWPP